MIIYKSFMFTIDYENILLKHCVVCESILLSFDIVRVLHLKCHNTKLTGVEGFYRSIVSVPSVNFWKWRTYLAFLCLAFLIT